jgi:endonuclease I
MRRIALFIYFSLSISLWAQIPAGYYDSAEGLDDEQLKTALYNIIKGHTVFPYTSDDTDVWDILKQTDKDPNNSANVILLYTGWSVDASQEYNSGSGWSREHVWSKSRGDFGTTTTAGSDVHNLRPADISVNSAKNNRWFDECSEPYEDGGQYTGCFTSSTDWVWKPREEVKGDVARMIFYMATRYEGENGEPDLEIVDYLPADDNTTDPIYAKLSTLLLWHNEDPVDDWERNRNDIIYYSFQNNRNPFIDHPEYANYIWGDESPPLAADYFTTTNQVVFYPNPVKDILYIKSEGIVQSIEVIDVLGRVVFTAQSSSNQINLSSIESGSYTVHINTENNRIPIQIVKY